MRHETAFASDERLTTQTSREIALAGAHHLALWTNVTAFGGGTNLVVSVEGKDATSGAWGPIKAFTARTATGLYRDVVRLETDGALPVRIRVKATVTGTFTDLTYSVGVDAA